MRASAIPLTLLGVTKSLIGMPGGGTVSKDCKRLIEVVCGQFIPL
jgi:hypothetical protein